MEVSDSPKEEICFLPVCHHISNAAYLKKEETWFGIQIVAAAAAAAAAATAANFMSLTRFF
jgi:hypothetical protein